MITSIQMKNCATYGDEVESLSSLQKVNFIYGANGSGKSTISSFLQNPLDEKYSQCKIERNDDSSVIVVYNKKFKEEHFKENIDGIFTLGKDAKDRSNEIAELKEQRKKIESRISGLKRDYSKRIEETEATEKQFIDSIWKAIIVQHKDVFSEAFKGFMGKKTTFFDELKRRYEIRSDVNNTYEALVNRAGVLFSEKPMSCDSFSLRIEENVNGIEDIVNQTIWKTVIVGNNDVPIAKMILELNNNDWVHEGMSYIRDTGKCPFCQKDTIDDAFLDCLSQYFDDEYKKNTERMIILSESYQEQTRLVLQKFSSLLDCEDKIQVGNLDVNRFNLLLDKLKLIIENNHEKINAKIKEPTRVFVMDSIMPICVSLYKLVESANKSISKHNDMVRHYGEERKALIDDIWNYCIREHKELIGNYRTKAYANSKALKGLNEAIKDALQKYDLINDQIIEIEKNTTSVQSTVDEINRSLKAFGFHGFMIVPSKEKENAYQIQREDGTLANNTLSEGEETFITFLYFMQYAKGSPDIRQVSSKKIVVLDDPICSLDSNVLYVVSAMVKELANEVKKGTSDVEQIIILTHNVFFHKEASFIDGRTKADKDVNYWIISKSNNSSNIRAYGQENPISTSYELLWRELRDNSEASKVTIQNIMRRIIENYFNILGSKKNDVIINSFDTLEERKICKSLLSWVNDGSHSITDDIYIDSYSDSADKYKSVFRQIFVNTKNLAHYNMMMGITDESEDVE